MRRFSKIMGEILLILLILFILLLGIARTFFPNVDQYKPYFEKRASIILNYPVHIGKIQTARSGLYPVLSMEDVEILDRKTTSTHLHIKRLKISVDVISSLFHRQLVPASITVLSTHFQIHRIDPHTLAVNDIPLPIEENTTPGADIGSMILWLQQRGRIRLEGISVDWENKQGRLFKVTDLTIVLRNGFLGRKVVGIATLLGKEPARFRFVLNFSGKGTQKEQIRAQLYIFIKQLDLTPWLDNKVLYGLQLKQSTLDHLQLWATWENNQWQSLQAIFQLEQMLLESTEHKQDTDINQASANIAWQRTHDGFSFAANKIKLIQNQQAWPLTKLSMQQTATTQIYTADQLDLKQLQTLANTTSLLPDTLKTQLGAIQPEGKLTHFLLRRGISILNSHAQLSMSTTFSALKIRPWKKMPGIDGLQGSIQLASNAGDLSISGENALEVNMPNWFNHPFTLNQYHGRIQWIQQADGLKLQASDIRFADKHLGVNANLNMWISPQNTPYVQLLAAYTEQNASYIRDYVPTELIHTNHSLSTWLTEAFPAGDSVNGEILLQGPLTHFPYDDHTGRFEASAHVKNMLFNYKTGWPPITHLNADALFDGRSLNIQTPPVPLQTTHMRGMIACPILDKAAYASKQICLEHVGESKQISPINQNISLWSEHPQQAQIFEALIDTATAQIPDLAHAELAVQGNVKADMQDGLRFIAQSPLKKILDKGLEKLTLKGGMQFSLGLHIPLHPRDSPKTTTVNGHVTLSPHGKLDIPLWNIHLTDLYGGFAFTENSLSSKQLTAKWLEQPLTAHIDTQHTDTDTHTIRINIKGHTTVEDLQKIYDLNFLKNKVTGKTNYTALLQLRHTMGSLSQTIFSVDSNLRGIDISLPEPLKKSSAEVRPTHVKVKESNESLNIDIAQFTASDEPLLSAHVIQQLQPDQWSIDVDSPTIAGQLIIPTPLSRPLEGNFTRFRLNPSDTKKTININPGDIPPLNLRFKNFYYGDKPFGTVSLLTSSGKNVLEVRQLSVDLADTYLLATGRWQQIDKDRQQTTLSGDLNSNNIGAALKTWQVTSSIVKGSGKMAFALSWPTAPYDLNTKELNGRFSLAFNQGNIINISAYQEAEMGIGRILNLLSLQSIPRRLSLDFGDLLDKGFVFDDMSGDFVMQNGNAITNNGVLNGPIAKIKITGRIGLGHKDYDLTMTTIPYVTSSLPLAATIVGGPIVGAATWLGNKVFGGVVNKIVGKTYRIKGSWDKPIVETAW